MSVGKPSESDFDVVLCPWGHARTKAQHDDAARTPCRICTTYNREPKKAAEWTPYSLDEFAAIHNALHEQSHMDLVSNYTSRVMRELELLHEKNLPEPTTGIGAKP